MDVRINIYKDTDCVLYSPWEQPPLWTPTVEVDSSLLERWKKCRDEYAALQRIFLGLYNIQIDKAQNES